MTWTDIFAIIGLIVLIAMIIVIAGIWVRGAK